MLQKFKIKIIDAILIHLEVGLPVAQLLQLPHLPAEAPKIQVSEYFGLNAQLPQSASTLWGALRAWFSCSLISSSILEVYLRSPTLSCLLRPSLADKADAKDRGIPEDETTRA